MKYSRHYQKSSVGGCYCDTGILLRSRFISSGNAIIRFFSTTIGLLPSAFITKSWLSRKANSVLPNLLSTTAHLFGTTQQTAHCISGTYFLYTTCMAYDLHNDVQLCI